MTLTAEQIETRKRGVGGSEILAAIGKDPRCSRLELYKRKVGELPELDLSDNERVRFGNLLEPVIRGEFSRRMGCEVIVPTQTLIHPNAPLLGHPDGWMPALSKGLEIKTADKYEADEFGEQDSDQVPVRYLVQCAAYMALTDAESWYLCVLIGGNDLRTYEIPRDPQIEAAVLAGASEFWSHVERRTPPDPMTPEEVRLRWPKDTGATAVASLEASSACWQLRDVKHELKQFELREEELRSEIQRCMQEAGNLVDSDGTLLATWRTAKPSMKFDTEAFAAAHPELYAQYCKSVPGSRRFLLKVK